MVKLYHYSKDKYDRLETKAFREGEKDFSISYNHHISFFWEKAPIDKLIKLFQKEGHPFWKNDTYYEYEINLTRLGKMYYKLVEHPEITELIYDDNVSDREFDKLRKKIIKENKLEGLKLTDLETAIRSVPHPIIYYYNLLPKRPNWDDLRKKYAGSVPHLMLYIPDGFIDFNNVKELDHN